MNIKKAKNVYCIGIGGVGLSGLAQVLYWQGKTVIGSDLVPSRVTDSIKKLGIQVNIGSPNSQHVPADTDVVLYSLAIKDDHPELAEAKRHGAQPLTYPEALGEITKDKKLITISGTHGKTTTTALVGQMLIQAGFDPTVIVGCLVPDFGSNARLGKSEYFVIEADEYGRALLNYSPTVAILTNIEPDHLDTYKDLQDIKETFIKFLQKVDPDGIIIANIDDPTIKDVVKSFSNPAPVITYGINGGEYQGKDINIGQNTKFTETHIGEIALGLSGRHNVINALAVIACGHQLGIEPEIIKQTLRNFKKLWRRFELVGVYKDCPVISDYAHHPTELRATLATAQKVYPDKSIVLVYQPHQRHRTKKLYKEFIKSFDQADRIIMSEIYDVAGREEEDNVISSKQLVEELRQQNKDIEYAKDLKETRVLIESTISPGEVILITGAGTIDQVARELVNDIR
ncbi:UDP-N-acetylmuramate--L-alanine ligase [Patescibacteria group bacterium]|nr:UDP-N-acetylmuramate--L-alanine ligase [Patescibacteria group bacterium]MBU1890756.1 UDP-N-acetylmuramate--L-alanine ligase [Patescibacteria group bacterium]